MTDNDLSSLIAVGATDVDFRILENRRFEISAGLRKYVLSVEEEHLDALSHVIADVVPKLRRSAPVREQLSADEAKRLLPYLRQLRDLGVLLFPATDAVTAIESQEDLRLYSFISRRTTTPDRVFTAAKARRIDLRGPAPITAALAEPLTAQGLTVGAVGPWSGRLEPEPDARLTIVVAAAGDPAVRAANRRFCELGSAWVPVVVAPQRVTIGPWVHPGESACLGCVSAPAGGVARGDGAAPVGRAAPAGAAQRIGAGAASWLTAQPGFLGWAGGLIAHLALRVCVPMGAAHPWGQVTELDAVGGEQTSYRAWRDPYCGACATRSPVAQEWTEL